VGKNKVKSNSPSKETSEPARAKRLLLRMLWASQPISRIELARHININRSTATEIFKPLINSGVIIEKPLTTKDSILPVGRPPIGLAFNDERDFFIGVNLGVSHSQIGTTTLKWDFNGGEEFVTPQDPKKALQIISDRIKKIWSKSSERQLRVVGISVPGPTDNERRKLIYAPHLGWEQVEIADYLEKSLGLEKAGISIVVENNATASAMYEVRLKFGRDRTIRDYTVVRSGTGIGVGLIFDGEVYRGTGRGTGIAGEFGHMTILAGGKPCVCGNRGCWECYASARAAAALYLGDRQQLGDLKAIRFAEIVNRAVGGELRAQRTLEKVGEYLGVGIANIIMGFGVPNVIVSGRLVYGWKFLNEPLREAIRRSMASKVENWSVESGEPHGASLGGALEIAVEEFFTQYLIHGTEF
jgi:predicted NBD/HSP70 family sugar kinase